MAVWTLNDVLTDAIRTAQVENLERLYAKVPEARLREWANEGQRELVAWTRLPIAWYAVSGGSVANQQRYGLNDPWNRTILHIWQVEFDGRLILGTYPGEPEESVTRATINRNDPPLSTYPRQWLYVRNLELQLWPASQEDDKTIWLLLTLQPDDFASLTSVLVGPDRYHRLVGDYVAWRIVDTVGNPDRAAILENRWIAGLNKAMEREREYWPQGRKVALPLYTKP